MATKLGVILADFTTQLDTSLSVGATTASIRSATDDDNNALPAGRYFFSIDTNNSNKEHISCDLSGTSLTNIKSLSRQGVETTGVARAHRVGATVTLTDFAHIKYMNDLLKGVTQLDSAAPLGYDGAPASITGNQLTTATWVLGVVTGGTVSFDQQVAAGQTLGETIAVNDVVYFKESDQRWWKADADLTATFDQVRIGISKNSGVAGGTATIAISGPVSGFTGLTAGSKYYLSNTAGAISTTAGTNSVFIGWALTSSTLLFDPISKTLPSQNEKNALAGTVGTPSSSNKFVTASGTTSLGTDQSQATQDSNTAFGEANSTTRRNKIAQSFVAADHYLRGVSLNKQANTGTFTGTVTVSVQADSSGNPSGVALVSKTISNTTYNLYSTGIFYVVFTSELATTPGTTYWIVAETSTSDNSNRPSLGINTAGGYASGSLKYWNTTDGWTSAGTTDLTFSTLIGLGGRAIKDTNANSDTISSSLPALLTTKIAQSTVTTSNTAITHNSGKVPKKVIVRLAQGSSSLASFAQTVMDIATGTAINNAFHYNEATDGWSINQVAAYGSLTGGIAPSGSSASAPTQWLTFVSIDENVLVMTTNTGSNTYTFEFIA